MTKRYFKNTDLEGFADNTLLVLYENEIDETYLVDNQLDIRYAPHWPFNKIMENVALKVWVEIDEDEALEIMKEGEINEVE